MKINEVRRNKLVDVLSDVLNRLCDRNDQFIMNNTPVTRFHALQATQITIKFYLQRIAKYSSCSEECFVLALIYIDRIIRKNSNFRVNSLNVHRLMITSIMLGAKYSYNHYFNNAYFGKIGGVSLKEMNLLEIEFLFMINFNLYVETSMYETYNERLLMSHSQPQENVQKHYASQNCDALAKTTQPGKPAVRQYPTQRCAAPRSKFLQMTE